MTTLLTPDEVAKILKVSYEQALKFIKYSGIKYIKIGRQYRVHSHVLDEYLHKTHSISIEPD